MIKNRILSFVCCLSIISACYPFLSGCEDKKENENKESNEIWDNEQGNSYTGKTKIWSTYNTLKILPYYRDYPDLGKQLDTIIAKGETEGAQLVITPEKDIKNVEIDITNLVNSNGDIFSKDNINIYFQKYINVMFKTYDQNNNKYPEGLTPDMMLPMDVAVLYKENKIKKGMNQGINIEFTTNKDTIPSIYTGELTLKLDGDKYNIPVTLDVKDIDINRTYNKTCIWTWGFSSMGGEYNLYDNYSTYYEKAMNEYRFNYDYLPGSRYPNRLVENLLKYWDNPHFSSYCIPVHGVWNKTYSVLSKGEFYSYLYEISKYCDEEKILFDKANIITYADEPVPADFPTVHAMIEGIYEVEQKLIDDLEKEGYFNSKSEKFKKDFCDSVKSISILQTANKNQLSMLGDSVNSYCPQINQFETPANREMYKNVKDKNKERGGETWYYTCMLPVYPYPSHHIDDNLIGQRIMSWMQKDYDLDGYLHWSFNRYEADDRTIDPYFDSSRFPNTQGDGYMYYPGKKYGMNEFIPSIRLSAFRDGLEDYDILCYLDTLIEEKEKFYGLDNGSIDIAILLKDIYKSLYDGCIYNESDEIFYKARENIFNLIEKQKSETQFLIKNTIKKDNVKTNIYLNKGYELKVNGEIIPVKQALGGGNEFEIVSPTKDNVILNIEVLKNGNSIENYDIFVTSKISSIVLDKNNDSFEVEKGSIIDIKDNKAFITLKSQKMDSIRDEMTFKPSVGILGQTVNNVRLTEVDDLRFTIKNTSDKEISLYSRFNRNSSNYNMVTYTLLPNEEREIIINDIYSYEKQFRNLKNSTFELFINNSDAEGNLSSDVSFVLSNVYYNKKGDNNL